MQVNDQQVEKILKDCAKLFAREKNSQDNQATSPQSSSRIEQHPKSESGDAAAQQTDSIPPQIGHYKILSELGRGSMGKVLKAMDTSLERTVALKMLYPNIMADEEMVARFKREAKCYAKLRHPRIVSLYEFFHSNETYFLVMQWIEGHSLEQRMKQKLTIPQICHWMLQILDAINYSHQNKILHRDMKPSNILVDQQNNIFITDFGIAKSLAEESQHLSTTGVILGTPTYMSPEQAKGTSGSLLDGRTDIYSIGVIFYEMLTGHPPFQDNNIFNLIYRIVNEDIPLPKNSNPTISDELQKICMKSLHKDREKRYTTASEMASDIQAYLDQIHPPLTANQAITIRMQTNDSILMQKNHYIPPAIPASSSMIQVRPASIQKKYSLLEFAIGIILILLVSVVCVLFLQEQQPLDSNFVTDSIIREDNTPTPPPYHKPPPPPREPRMPKERPDEEKWKRNMFDEGPHGPQMDEKKFARYIIRQMDRNEDNKINRNEWTAMPGLFDPLDEDRDGFLTQRELEKASYFRLWQNP